MKFDEWLVRWLRWNKHTAYSLTPKPIFLESPQVDLELDTSDGTKTTLKAYELGGGGQFK